MNVHVYLILLLGVTETLKPIDVIHFLHEMLYNGIYYVV